ncbi:MAG: hypothetical protein ACFFKA_06730, partial [Candidatus Thorarchaeota archaeon]
MGKDPQATAESQIIKADQLFKALLFKKAGKTYHSAGNTFLKLNQFQIAKKCFLNSMTSFLELERFETAIELLRQAGEACLLDNQYLQAFQLYKDAFNYIPKLKSEVDRNSSYILFLFLSYLCLHAKGSPQEGLDFIKRNRNKIDNEFFKESNLIQLISELTITLRDKTEKYLEKIQNDINQLKLRTVESDLLSRVILLTKFQILLKSSPKLDRGTYNTNEVINLDLELDTSPFIQIIKDSSLNYDIKSFKITNILVNLSDNLTANKKPDLPFSIDFGSKINLQFAFKSFFQIDKPNIGPFNLTFEINNLLIFNYETTIITPHITAPPASLLTSIKNLRPPLLDQTFPLEILVENRSEGEALDVNLQLQFPEELKLMRGTTDKQIYS